MERRGCKNWRELVAGAGVDEVDVDGGEAGLAIAIAVATETASETVSGPDSESDENGPVKGCCWRG